MSTKTKWNLPSYDCGLSFMVRSYKAEEHLTQALNLLEKVKDSIPHTPAQTTRQEIISFLHRFQ